MTPPMPRETRQQRRASRTRRLLVGGTLIVAGVGIASIAVYLLYLDRFITTTFDGRRWSVPARVYAQPLELYPGLPIEAAEVELEFKRLGYRSGRLNAPGSYIRNGNEIRAVLRAFHIQRCSATGDPDSCAHRGSRARFTDCRSTADQSRAPRTAADRQFFRNSRRGSADRDAGGNSAAAH